MITFGGILFGGVRGSMYVAYIIPLQLATLLLNRDSIFLIGILSIISGSIQFVLTIFGVFPSSILELTLFERYFTTTGILIFMIGAFLLARYNFRVSKEYAEKYWAQNLEITRQLEEVENLFTQLFESVDEVVFVYSLDKNKLLHVNSRIEDVFNINHNEILNNNAKFWELFPYIDKRMQDIIERNLKMAKFSHTVKIDGGSREFETKLYPMKDADGKIYRIAGIVQDRTQEIRLQEKQKQYRKRINERRQLQELGQLVATVAHDFRNYLQAIQGDLGILETVDHELVEKETNSIKEIIQDAKKLISEMLIFASDHQPNTKKVDCKKIVKQSIERSLSILDNNIEIKTHFQQNITIEVDPEHLRKSLLNLVKNANESMDEGGILMLRVEKVDIQEEIHTFDMYSLKGKYCKISVCDTGRGMDNKTKHKLFKPFYTTKTGGTGLGLSSVREMIRMNGGYIDFESEIDEGTKFEIYFPIDR